MWRSVRLRKKAVWLLSPVQFKDTFQVKVDSFLISLIVIKYTDSQAFSFLVLSLRRRGIWCKFCDTPLRFLDTRVIIYNTGMIIAWSSPLGEQVPPREPSYSWTQLLSQHDLGSKAGGKWPGREAWACQELSLLPTHYHRREGFCLDPVGTI